MVDLIYREESYALIGCCMEVYNVLGHGFLEAVYQEALARELKRSGIPFRREVPLEIFYKGELLNKNYFADFVCFDKIIIETKALPALLPAHAAQVFNYLKATRLQLGLLVNFGCSERLQYSRHINLPRTTINTDPGNTDSTQVNTNLTNSTNKTNYVASSSDPLNSRNPCLKAPSPSSSSDLLNSRNPCLKAPGPSSSSDPSFPNSCKND